MADAEAAQGHMLPGLLARRGVLWEVFWEAGAGQASYLLFASTCEVWVSSPGAGIRAASFFFLFFFFKILFIYS